MRTPSGRTIAGVVLSCWASMLAGCTHAATFEREREPALRARPTLASTVGVRLEATRGTDTRFARELSRALASREGIALVGSGAFADYTLRLHVVRRAGASPSNFLICWPGFLVFAPAWHGLEWPYALESRVIIVRRDGATIAGFDDERSWRARYTSVWFGLAADMGWLPLFYTLPALEAGIDAAVGEPDACALDEAFLSSEGDIWAREVAEAVVSAIARDVGSSEWQRGP